MRGLGLMKKFSNPVKRKILQICAFGFCNPYVQNFFNGKISGAKWKSFCVPGLNCYSCPAAAFSCPIGALQAVGGSADFKFSFYVAGLLLAFGALLGRAVCGFLCPFGLLQELIFKIPAPKIKLPRAVKYIKYFVLLIFVLILPAADTNYAGLGDPAFCKYICPAGTFEAGLPLAAMHPELRPALGNLFALKVGVLAFVLLACVFVARFFCKALCPLGAIYGFFNKLSFYRLNFQKEKCVSCKKCAELCPMDIDPTRSPNSFECVRCSKCADACPTGAIRLGFFCRSH